MQKPRNDSLLNDLISKCETLIDKANLHCLHDFSFCPSDEAKEGIRLLQVEVLTTPLSPDFFTFVLNALGNLKEVFGYILRSSQHQPELYIGLKTDEGMRSALDILKNGLKNTYPNSKFKELSPKESSLILKDLFNAKSYQTLSAAVVIPNNTSPSHAPINQKLLDLMGGEEFTALFLASPITQCEIKCFTDELKSLYTTLSAFKENILSFSQSSSKNTASHVSKTITENENNNRLEIQGNLHTCNAAQYTLLTPSISTTLENSRIFNVSISFYQTTGIADTYNQATERGESRGRSTSKMDLHINSGTITNTDSLSYVSQNKFVIDLLEQLDSLIARLTQSASGPLFYFGAYFLSSAAATSIRAAYTYSGLAKDETLNIEQSYVITWEDSEENFSKLIQELKGFNQLSFSPPRGNQCVTTTALITSAELLNSFYFPFPQASL
jgi:hypothetical protein